MAEINYYIKRYYSGDMTIDLDSVIQKIFSFSLKTS